MAAEEGTSEPAPPAADDPLAAPRDDEPVRFEVIYDGSAHEAHDIDIEMFAESLAALKTAITEASRTLHPNKPELDIRVSDDFESGSFGFFVSVVNHTAEALATLEALGFVLKAGAATGGALAVINAIRGRTIEAIVDDGAVGESDVIKRDVIIAIVNDDDEGEAVDSPTNQLSTSSEGSDAPRKVAAVKTIKLDGEDVTAESAVIDLVTNPKVRKALQKVVAAPLESGGTTSVRFADARGESPFVVREFATSDAPAFDPPKFVEEPADPPRETSVVFLRADVAMPGETDASKGWRVRDLDGGGEFAVRMRDGAFIQRLQSGNEPEIFSKPYRVQLETTRPPKQSGRRIVRTIVHVRQPTETG